MLKTHLRHESPISESQGLLLAERRLSGMINLRGSPNDSVFIDRIGKIIGVPVPTIPNRFIEQGDMQCLWQGPDEWLFVVPDDRQHLLIEDLEATLEGLHHAVTDVTGNRIVFRLSGLNAATVLASGCSLDFAASAFPRGTAAQTILARTPVTILRIDDAPTFDIHARRSYRAWLQDWLARATRSADTP